MTSMPRWSFIALTLLSAPLVLAKGSSESGAAKAVTCQACHGANGNSVIAQYPNLAGQNAVYLVRQLKAFKSNKRINSNGVMMGMSATLDDQGMEDVATYFSLQTPTGAEADPSLVDAGRKLWRAGDAARGIPACMACHGPSGKGNPAAGYPALRAQHAEYVLKQLTEYAEDKRYSVNEKGETDGGANAAIMNTIARRLTADDMRSLASYAQGLRD